MRSKPTGPNGPRTKYGFDSQPITQSDLPVPFPRPIGPRAEELLKEVVESGLTSDMVDRFEIAFARASGVKHCIATPGCTPALSVLAATFDFEPGDEIIVSPISDFGTVQGLIAQNYIPVFADVEPNTVNITAETIKPYIGKRTRAILVVHMTGLICDMDPINELADKHGLIVYEDACQAVFGQYKGKYAGTMSTAGAFSFDSEKTMGSDVGGCILTDDDSLAEQARLVGQSRGSQTVAHFGRVHTTNGFAHRMTQSTAALTLAQLDIIGPQVAQRDRMIRLLYEMLDEIPGIAPIHIPEYVDTYSCWMAGFTIDPQQFSCDTETFGNRLADGGIPGAGQARYYLLQEALPFLKEKAISRIYPYSEPPASRSYKYEASNTPNAHSFLERFVRWSTFCEKYDESHCELAANIVRRIADQNRR